VEKSFWNFRGRRAHSIIEPRPSFHRFRNDYTGQRLKTWNTTNVEGGIPLADGMQGLDGNCNRRMPAREKEQRPHH
jgi:hypothetical protein